MTTEIFDQFNNKVSAGKNLRLLLHHGNKRGGIVHITIVKSRAANPEYEALMNVKFADGYRGVTEFHKFKAAKEWAEMKKWQGKTSPECLIELVE